MKPLSLKRAAALGGTLSLLRASTALAHTSSVSTHHAAAPRMNDAFERTKLHLTTASTHAAAGGSASGSIVRTVVGLAIVIAVIYGLTWIMRQAKSAKNPSRGAGLEQIASLPLGTNRSVALVRVGAELHLLGIAEHSVTGIRTFTEDEAIDAGLPVAAPGETSSASSPSDPLLVRAVEALRRMTVR